MEIPKTVAPETKNQIKNDVGEYLIEQILLSVGESKSPLSGERFKALSKDYRAKKMAEGAPGVPNLELNGDMLSSLTYEEKDEGIEIGVFGADAPKADGHNNFSGKSSLPERRFLPSQGEGFKPSIEKEIQAIVQDAIAEEAEIIEAEFDEASSSSTFYDVLISQLGVETRAEARATVLRTPKWYNFLTSSGLIKWL